MKLLLTKRTKPGPFRRCCLVLLVLVPQAESAWAGDILMEIFFLPHRPAMAVVDEVEKVAAEFAGVVVRTYSFDDPSSGKLVEKYDLAGHMPVAIFIDGKNRFRLAEHTVSLRNFPKGNDFVPMFAGEWDYDDLRAILREKSAKQ